MTHLINVRDLYPIVMGDEFSYIDCNDTSSKYTTRSKEALKLLSDSFVCMENHHYGITQGFRTFEGIPAFGYKYMGRKKVLTDLYATTANILLKSPEDAYYFYANNALRKLTLDEVRENKKRLSAYLKRYRCIQDMRNTMTIQEVLEHTTMAPYMIPKQNTGFVERFVNRYSGISKKQAIDFLPRGLNDLDAETIKELTKNKNTQRYILNSIELEEKDDGRKLYPTVPLPIEGDLYYFDIEFIPGTYDMISIAVASDTLLFSTTSIDEFDRFMRGRENAVLIHWSGVDARLLKRYLPNREYRTFDLLQFMRTENIATRGCYTRKLKQIHSALFGDKYGEGECTNGTDVCLLVKEGTLHNHLVPVMKYNINDCLMMKDIAELLQ